MQVKPRVPDLSLFAPALTFFSPTPRPPAVPQQTYHVLVALDALCGQGVVSFPIILPGILPSRRVNHAKNSVSSLCVAHSIGHNYRLFAVSRKCIGCSEWLIVHEHVSFPVDLDTGKADLLSKP